MRWNHGMAAGALVCALAGAASAQPTITSLGTNKPAAVTNELSGTYYIGGSQTRATLNGATLSQPAITGGTVSSANNISSADGRYVIGTVQNNGAVTGVGVTTVDPAWTIPGSFNTVVLGATAGIAARYDTMTSTWQALPGLPNDAYAQSQVSFGAGESSGVISDGFRLSSTGQFMVGRSYISAFNNTGTAISATAGRWRPFIWDASTNTIRQLPTPFRTSTFTQQRRNGLACDVSTDGTVVIGVLEHNQSAAASADPDGARPVVWRWNSSTSQYDMSYLPTGYMGNVFTSPVTNADFHLNDAGTIAVGRLPNDTGSTYIAKWVWNAGTSTWEAPINIGSRIGVPVLISTIACTGGVATATTSADHSLAVGDFVLISGNTTTAYNGLKTVINVPSTTTFEYTATCGADGTGGTMYRQASWLPASAVGCGVGSDSFSVNCMSEDGNWMGGTMRYTTCGSFVHGGWFWSSATGYMLDWYEHLLEEGVPGVAPNEPFGPIGDGGDMNRGQPVVGFPTGVSPDASAVVGFHSSNQMIVGAPGWILRWTGGAACVAPGISTQPSSSLTISRCPGSFGLIFNCNSGGTLPLTYQWYKDGNPLADGPAAGGGTITGATTIQMRINPPGNADVGVYTCVVSGCGMSSTTSNAATVTLAIGSPNDACASATEVGEGTFNFDPCNTWVDASAPTTPGFCSPFAEPADVWYKYTPTFTGEARFQTCGSNHDTTLHLYDMCGGMELPGASCNNDVGARGLAGIGTSCSSNRAVISRYPVTMGVPIWVRVATVTMPTSAGATNGALSISQAPAAPANDLCTNATPVGLGTHAFNLSDADVDQFTYGTNIGCSTPAETTAASNRDVWFRFTPPCGTAGTYSITTCGLASPNITNPMLHIVSNDCGGPVVFVCDDNTSGCSAGGTSQAQILNFAYDPGVHGASVLIRVSQSGTGSPGTGPLSGTGQINITGGPTIPCPGACCAADGTCSVVLQVACTGTFQGLDTSCTPHPCPAGACCIGPACVTNADPFTCALNGGTWSYSNSCTITAGVPHNFCCPTNFDRNLVKDVADIFAGLAAYFANDPAMDWDGSGLPVLLSDFFLFFADWFVPC